MKPASTTAQPVELSSPFSKQVDYDRVTKDFAMFLDGELVGYARSYNEGRDTLDAIAYERAQLLGQSALVGNEALAEAVEAGAVPTETELEADKEEVAAVRAEQLADEAIDLAYRLDALSEHAWQGQQHAIENGQKHITAYYSARLDRLTCLLSKAHQRTHRRRRSSLAAGRKADAESERRMEEKIEADFTRTCEACDNGSEPGYPTCWACREAGEEEAREAWAGVQFAPSCEGCGSPAKRNCSVCEHCREAAQEQAGAVWGPSPLAAAMPLIDQFNAAQAVAE